MGQEEKAFTAFRDWYDSLPKKRGEEIPAKGTIAGALIVLERLKETFDLSIDAHTAPGGSQIVGVGGAAARSILAKFNETRPFLAEAGRTNRGLRGKIDLLLKALDDAGLARLPKAKRNRVLIELQRFLVERVRDFHEFQRLDIAYDPSISSWQAISDLLDAARETGKDAPVAQYLVGAKLKLRFPEIEISNESFSTADVQLGRHGDFLVGNTVFHVTVSPSPAVYEKCKLNLKRGFKVYLLVRNRDVVGTKQNAENAASGQITVESIETFVGQNLDEMSNFSQELRTVELRRLLETYNSRVDAIEMNKSLMIEIPTNL